MLLPHNPRSTMYLAPDPDGAAADREAQGSEPHMLLRLLKRLIAWLKRPLFEGDDPLEEYWEHKRQQEQRRR